MLPTRAGALQLRALVSFANAALALALGKQLSDESFLSDLLVAGELSDIPTERVVRENIVAEDYRYNVVVRTPPTSHVRHCPKTGNNCSPFRQVFLR